MQPQTNQRQVTLILVGTMKRVMATLRAARHIKGNFWRSA
jgi:hypothetical protein